MGMSKKVVLRHAPSPAGWVPSEGTVASCGAYANNHDNSFYACAFIIRLNNPISCEHNRLISPYNKKECSFFEEIVAFSCICEKFVVPLHSLSIRKIYRGVEQW